MIKNSGPLTKFMLHTGLVLAVFLSLAQSQSSTKTFKTDHYNVHYTAAYEQLAGEIAEIAEAVWPMFATAYQAHNNYQTIDIFVVDPGDYANGNAIYTVSRVFIFAPHINWVMRGRRNWVGNVLAHELAHVFTLRRAARLSAFDAVGVQGARINSLFNYNFQLYWQPLVAPTWYVEGIAQFEAEEAGYDTWDSQRDLIVRDGYLTGTLPKLGEIETFDGDWVSSERVYNTGFAFLRFLRDKYGKQKVRKLAEPKPVFNFTYSAKLAFGKSISDLYEEFKASLAEKYQDYKTLPEEKIFIEGGSYTTSLAISPNGKYIAWIDNDDRWSPVNWIYWKETKTGKVHKEKIEAPKPVKKDETKAKEGEEWTGTAIQEDYSTDPWFRTVRDPLHQNFHNVVPKKGRNTTGIHSERQGKNRSWRFGAQGLQFNKKGNRLLTTRNSRSISMADEEKSSPYSDIWEYDFKNDSWQRLTWWERASYASYHPTDSRIVFVKKVKRNGSTGNIAILHKSGKVDQLTNFKEGQQIYNPKFNPAGDSIYFTLGIDGDEGIVSIPANAAPYDIYKVMREDSTLFPDSIVVAGDVAFNFITALDSNLDRDIFFVGDTMYFSSYYGNRQYNIFAKIKGDSTLYQVTKIKSQALEPLVRGGDLYYQGYQKQHFNIYKQPLALTATGITLAPTDSLPLKRKKKLKYADHFETGEYRGDGIAWDITPFISFLPKTVGDTSFISNLGLGIGIATGGLRSFVNQYVEAEISNNFDGRTPSNYNFLYQGMLNRAALRHTRYTWIPQINYAFYHSVYNDVEEETLTFPNIDPAINDVIRVDPTGAQDQINGDSLFYSFHEIIKFKQTYNYFGMGTALPLRLYSVTSWMEIKLDQQIHDTFIGWFANNGYTLANNDQPGGPIEPLHSDLNDQPMFSYIRTQLGWSWSKFKIGLRYPSGFGLGTSVGKAWSTYADTVIFLDPEDDMLCAIENEKCGNVVFNQEKFAPFDQNLYFFGYYSIADKVTFGGIVQAATYWERFPEYGPGRSEPHPNLYPLSYRLGLSRMAGYGYSMPYYNGRHLVEGTNMFWSQFLVDVPLKLHAFIPNSIFPFSSLNQIKLNLVGDAGFTLDEKPGDILDAMGMQDNLFDWEDGNHEWLFDIGVRLSANFLMYHRLPMTLYIQAFQPINHLRWQNFGNWILEDVPDVTNTTTYEQWRFESYGDRVTQLRASGDNDGALAVEKGAVDLANDINSFRFYVGLAVGMF